MEHFLYLFLNVFSISYPIYKSFDPRVNYVKNWKNVILATLPMLAIMIVWDIIFTHQGFWGFNPAYNLGVSVFGLPLEEWLFFICIPFASVFIYEVVIYYDKNNRLKKFASPVNGLMMVVSFGFIMLGYNQWYTVVTGVALLSLTLIHQFVLKTQHTYLGRFYVALLFIFIPFIGVNGILTGSFIPDQVVWYNMNETFGIRVFTIPMEDFFYCTFMMLLTITVFEYLKSKKA